MEQNFVVEFLFADRRSHEDVNKQYGRDVDNDIILIKVAELKKLVARQTP